MIILTFSLVPAAEEEKAWLESIRRINRPAMHIIAGKRATRTNETLILPRIPVLFLRHCVVMICISAQMGYQSTPIPC